MKGWNDTARRLPRIGMRWALQAALLAILAVMVTGCLYPQSERKENQVAAEEYLLVVQNAVDRYKERTGVLPIKNSEMDTPVYEKYKIDFRQLKQWGMISTVPANAFENGGTNYYVIVDPETKPTVKLMSLLTFESVADMQRRVDEYKKKKDGKLPLGERVEADFHRIDGDALGVSNPQAKSVYSGQYLGYLLDESGRVYIDYAPDIMQQMNRKGIAQAEPDVDLRTYLVSESPFVPVGSVPYHWAGDGPAPKRP